MTWYYIIGLILSVAIYVFAGIICGRICANIVNQKNKKSNQVDWFWLGFLFCFVGILLTLVLKDDNKSE